jgi:hypothetical protein
MKKIFFSLIGLTLICFSQLMGQQNTAADYWKMERDSAYLSLKTRQNSNEMLTQQEKNYLAEYKTKLAGYFENMSDEEKSVYYKNRSKWSEQPVNTPMIAVEQNTDIYSGQKSAYSKYLVSSGFFGFLYGSSAAYIINAKGGGIAGLPLLAAGASTLIPMLTIKDKKVTYNSLTLSLHGKTMGFFHGSAFALLLTGSEINQSEKFTVGIATLSSIGLGRLGYELGRNKPWTRGRVGLYTHYGSLMPFEGLALDAVLNIQDPRLYAATFLAFGAGGYYIADRVAQWNDYTPGDITATQTFSYLNGLLGLGIMFDIAGNGDLSQSTLLFPALGALGGTVAGHFWLRDTKLTNQQGRNVALGTAGGAVIGLGITAILGLETATFYYVVPYIGGLTTYALLVNNYRQKNNFIFQEGKKTSGWEFNLMPQNIILNQKIATMAGTNPARQTIYLPAFSARLNF